MSFRYKRPKEPQQPSKQSSTGTAGSISGSLAVMHPDNDIQITVF
jgi:hypothetical protein